jgi:hypothetical protein
LVVHEVSPLEHAVDPQAAVDDRGDRRISLTATVDGALMLMLASRDDVSGRV